MDITYFVAPGVERVIFFLGRNIRPPRDGRSLLVGHKSRVDVCGQVVDFAHVILHALDKRKVVRIVLGRHLEAKRGHQCLEGRLVEAIVPGQSVTTCNIGISPLPSSQHYRVAPTEWRSVR